jgi:hypothetical protein
MTLAWKLSLAVQIALVVRLWFGRLMPVFPAFAGYVIASILRTILLFNFNVTSREYAYAWGYTEPFLWLLRAALAAEIYGRLKEHYPEIELISGKLYAAFLAIAAAGASLILAFELHRIPNSNPFLFVKQIQFAITRFESTSIAFFLLALCLFVRMSQRPIARNLLRHGIFSGLHFVLLSITYLWMNFGGYSLVMRFVIPATWLCWFGWVFAFRAGENDVPVAVGGPFSLVEWRQFKDRLLGHTQGTARNIVD